jgi:hypothetical protein
LSSLVLSVLSTSYKLVLTLLPLALGGDNKAPAYEKVGIGKSTGVEPKSWKEDIATESEADVCYTLCFNLTEHTFHI